MSHFGSLRALAASFAIALLIAGCGGGGDATTSNATGSSGGNNAGSNGSSTSKAAAISGTPATSATVGQAYSFQPTGSGASGSTLTYSATGLPSWLSINSTTGMLTGTPAAGDVGTTASITISVSDGTTSASLSGFSLTVNQIGNGSAVLSWTIPTQNTDGSTLTVASYKILYGTAATALTQQVAISNPSLSTYTVTNLSSGTWYFAIVSIDSSGSQSIPTNVASITI